MEDAKDKKLPKNQETIKPDVDASEEGVLPEKDLDKVSGGSISFQKIE